MISPEALDALRSQLSPEIWDNTWDIYTRFRFGRGWDERPPSGLVNEQLFDLLLGIVPVDTHRTNVLE